MEYLLIALVVILGIALSISLLNKLRRQRSREQIERSTPLSEPDFDFSRLGASAANEKTVEADTGETGAAAQEVEQNDQQKGEQNIEKGQDLPLTLEEPTGTSAADSSQPAAPPATLTEMVPLIRQYRDSGDLEKARELCELHLPKTQAFQQLLMTQRVTLKTLMQRKQDATQALSRLYTTAVVAELYRSSRKLPTTVQQATHACTLIEHFKPEYQLLGYSNLRGLIRADITLLVRLWGEPLNHHHPVTALPPTWWQLDSPPEPSAALATEPPATAPDKP